jgi:ketosteroid isomerase-like protein
MNRTTPLELVRTLIDARARGDIATAVACYEKTALVIAAPDQRLSGEAAIKQFTVQAIALPLKFGAREIVEGDGIALHYSAWTMSLPNGSGGMNELSGRTTDLLRRQPDGRWLISIDNAWGVALLDAAIGVG